MSNDENKAVFQRVVDELWNGVRPDATDELYAADAPIHIPTSPDLAAGPAGAKSLYSTFRSAFPDLRVRIDRVHAMGDRVAGRVIAEGTHHGTFLDVPASGNAIDFTMIALFRLENGRIAESWYEYDALRVVQQIGAMPGGG